MPRGEQEPPNNLRIGIRRERRYFPQLDGLRFVAALLVLISHLDSPAEFFPDQTLGLGLLVRLNTFGWVGVDIFLVLSSYLIFSLLMEEKRTRGRISIRDFYIRRALRIWPLYFPYLMSAFFLLPLLIQPPVQLGPTLRQHLLPFLTFTGNLSYILYPTTLLFSFAHLWTISLEEQFYAVAPVIAFFGRALRPYAGRLAVLALAFTTGAKWYVMANAVPYPTIWVFTFCRLDPFVVGAALAVLFAKHPAFVRLPLGWLFMTLGGVGFYALSSAPQIGTTMQTVWQLQASAAASGALLLGVLLRAGGARIFSLPGLPYLGKISYGIYVYHEFALFLVRNDATSWLADIAAGVRWFLILILALALTVCMAAGSYQLWERRFLRFKLRFEVIPSRVA
jgi:peptidoglycan/LPS O-acetylase OafA/YrhL